jgi:hypothetical protein
VSVDLRDAPAARRALDVIDPLARLREDDRVDTDRMDV